MMAHEQQSTWPDLSLPDSIARASFQYYASFENDRLEYNTSRDEPVASGSNLWEKFFLHPPQIETPPGSPVRDESDFSSIDNSLESSATHMHAMPMSEVLDVNITNFRQFKEDPVLQDCMWSGKGTRAGRVRNVSLSELSMVSTSTSCIDPTTFNAYPRQHNQVEHNYSLATPEPMRVPKMYSNSKGYSSYDTPLTSENSESEEDVIDVVTVDSSGAVTQPHTLLQTKTTYAVRHKLQEVAHRLSTHPYKNPKCFSNSLTSKKSKHMISTPDSFGGGSFSGSDCEEYGVKRSAHNVMERKRRSELRQYLHRLRDQLPMKSDRPAKVLILVRARDAIQQLEAEELHCRQEYKMESQRNARLKQRLASLQEHLGLTF